MPKIGDVFNPYRMFTGIFIPEGVCRYKGIGGPQKLIYGRLLRYAGENGEAYPSIPTLAEEVGLCERQCRTHIETLEEHGFLNIEKREGRTDVYKFLFHECYDGDVGVPRQKPAGVSESDADPGRNLPGYPGRKLPPTPAETCRRRESVRESLEGESLSPYSPPDVFSENENPGAAGQNSGEQVEVLEGSAPEPAADVSTSVRFTETFDPVALYPMLRKRLKNDITGMTFNKAGAAKIIDALERIHEYVPEKAVWEAAARFAKADRSQVRDLASVFADNLKQLTSGPKIHAARRPAAPARSPEPDRPSGTPERATGLKTAFPAKVELWNAIVPEPLRVELWHSLSPIDELAEAETNPEFHRSFHLIATRAAKCHATGKLTPTFDWLFQKSKGKVNWYRMAAGLFSWAEETDKPPTPRGRAGANLSLADKLRAKIAAIEQAKLEAQKEKDSGKDGREHRESVTDAGRELGVPEGAGADGAGLEGARQDAA